MKRWWKYTTARLTGDFNANADPKVQLDQAIQESQDQHRRLKEQAANVIANQKQTEIRLNRAMEDYERAAGNARQAVLMADEAQRQGNTAKLTELTSVAELVAGKMISLEREVEDLKSLHLQASSASDQAKAAVNQNSAALQKKLGEQKKLLSQIDQAKMQEQLNTAMASLSETVGDDVPSFDEIRDRVELRYAKAKGVAELNETNVGARMLEVEQATMNIEAQARLSEIRTQLGLGPAQDQAAGSVNESSESEAAPATAQEPGA